MKIRPFFCLLVIGQSAVLTVCAQVQNYQQANNEFQFFREINKRWELEFDARQSWTTVPGGSNVFNSLSQLSGYLAVHYKPSNRWKVSYLFGYYFNEYVPELNQRGAPEWRSTIQGMYYIMRRRTTISTRLRIEDRHIANKDSIFEAQERFRTEIKAVYPFNGKSIKKGVIYGFASEELMFKTSSNVGGGGNFDRNKLEIGLGYNLGDNFQVELMYTNEYLPRKPVSNNYNEVQLTLIFYNVFKKIEKNLF